MCVEFDLLLLRAVSVWVDFALDERLVDRWEDIGILSPGSCLSQQVIMVTLTLTLILSHQRFSLLLVDVDIRVTRELAVTNEANQAHSSRHNSHNWIGLNKRASTNSSEAIITQRRATVSMRIRLGERIWPSGYSLLCKQCENCDCYARFNAIQFILCAPVLFHLVCSIQLLHFISFRTHRFAHAEIRSDRILVQLNSASMHAIQTHTMQANDDESEQLQFESQCSHYFLARSIVILLCYTLVNAEKLVKFAILVGIAIAGCSWRAVEHERRAGVENR